MVEALRGSETEIFRTAQSATGNNSADRRKTIVVVDDTEMLLIFMEDILATADPELRITTALSASDGLREIERLIPDLVLLDYSLPDFNGDKLCALLLQNERTANVPVLMMSGHVPEMTAAAARFPNIVAIIEKPFLSDALVSLVLRTLKAPAKKRAKPIESAPTAEPSDEEVRLRLLHFGAATRIWSPG